MLACFIWHPPPRRGRFRRWSPTARRFSKEFDSRSAMRSQEMAATQAALDALQEVTASAYVFSKSEFSMDFRDFAWNWSAITKKWGNKSKICFLEVFILCLNSLKQYTWSRKSIDKSAGKIVLWVGKSIFYQENPYCLRELIFEIFEGCRRRKQFFDRVGEWRPPEPSQRVREASRKSLQSMRSVQSARDTKILNF